MNANTSWRCRNERHAYRIVGRHEGGRLEHWACSRCGKGRYVSNLEARAASDAPFAVLLNELADTHQLEPSGRGCTCGWRQPRLSFWRQLIDIPYGPGNRHRDHVLDELSFEIDRRWPPLEIQGIGGIQ